MIIQQIQNRISEKGSGWIFSQTDFLDLGNRNAIDQSLYRLLKKGVIAKIVTGIYHVPRISNKFGPIPPTLDSIAYKIAHKLGYTLHISPAHAANRLGLSLQVPAQAMYLTDGLSKVVQIGNQIIHFRHVSPKKLIGAGTLAGDIIQAFYYFGKNHIDEALLQKMKRLVKNDNDRDTLHSAQNSVPQWMRALLQEICQYVH